jgi:hypothetical protein
VRERLVAKEALRGANAEFCGIENYQDFGDQGFDGGLAALTTDEAGDLVASSIQELLKFAQNRDAITSGSLSPGNLRVPGAQHRAVDILRRGAR